MVNEIVNKDECFYELYYSQKKKIIEKKAIYKLISLINAHNFNTDFRKKTLKLMLSDEFNEICDYMTHISRIFAV